MVAFHGRVVLDLFNDGKFAQQFDLLPGEGGGDGRDGLVLVFGEEMADVLLKPARFQESSGLLKTAITGKLSAAEAGAIMFSRSSKILLKLVSKDTGAGPAALGSRVRSALPARAGESKSRSKTSITGKIFAERL